MSDSVYSHDKDDVLTTGFRARSVDGYVSPVIWEARFEGEKRMSLAIGYGQTAQSAVIDLYRNYRDIKHALGE